MLNTITCVIAQTLNLTVLPFLYQVLYGVEMNVAAWKAPSYGKASWQHKLKPEIMQLDKT